MNTNNVIDFTSRKSISTPETEPENLLDITYLNVDEAFENFLFYMSEDLGYREVMVENEDLEIAMGYVLTIARSAWARACNLEDAMTPHLIDIIDSIKEDVKDDDSC